MSLTDDLMARRGELERELARLTAPPEAGATVSFGKRIGDGTAEAVERLATTATARSIAASIEEIDAALARIADRSYGVCERCGSQIAAARLEARPASVTCIDCASA